MHSSRGDCFQTPNYFLNRLICFYKLHRSGGLNNELSSGLFPITGDLCNELLGYSPANIVMPTSSRIVRLISWGD